MIRMKVRSIVCILLPMLALVACRSAFYRSSEPIPGRVWKAEHTVSFEVEVDDTTSGFDFYIDLRNEATYPYRNIFMFVNTTFPSGKTARDTVECFLADASGRWLGNGLGDILDNHILFKQNVRFPTTGTYTFEFEQGMRKRELAGILDVGISLEKHRR